MVYKFNLALSDNKNTHLFRESQIDGKNPIYRILYSRLPTLLSSEATFRSRLLKSDLSEYIVEVKDETSLILLSIERILLERSEILLPYDEP